MIKLGADGIDTKTSYHAMESTAIATQIEILQTQLYTNSYSHLEIKKIANENSTKPQPPSTIR